MKQNIPKSSLSGLHLFLRGEEELRAIHAAREVSKIGTLRVGSAGCMVGGSGATIGSAPHETLARFMGYQLPTSMSQSYFDGGIDNEFVWENNIKASGQTFKREEEFPINHKLPSGVTITGRPDMVLGDYINGEFIPSAVLELKSAQATKSAAEKLILEKPDKKHLIQAGCYGMFLGLPSSLIYTVNVSGVIGNGGKSDYWIQGECGRKDVPFGKIEFPIIWSNGQLLFERHGSMVETIITQDGIIDYYNNLVRMLEEQDLNIMFESNFDEYGKELPYDPSDYNTFTLMVDTDLPFKDWEDHVKYVCNQDLIIKSRTEGTGKNRKWVYSIVKGDHEVTHYSYYKDPKVVDEYESLARARKRLYKGE